MNISLEGKTAVVTGARRGIGRAIAENLARAGADIIGASKSMSEDDEVVAAVRGMGRKFDCYSCDFSDRKDLYRFSGEVIDSGRGVDILINNAGTILRKPAAEHPDEYWDTILAIDLDSPFILTRELAGPMLDRGEGKIVFIASLLTFQGGITVPGYAAAKGGIGQLVKALANEWAGRGVNVNGIAPGYIATDTTQALQDDETRNRQILERIPAGRWGRPDDIAGAALFLCSPLADYVHGTLVTVDGGWMGR